MVDKLTITRRAGRVFSGLEPPFFYKVTFSHSGNVTTATYHLDIANKPDTIVAVIERETDDYGRCVREEIIFIDNTQYT